MLLSSDIWVWVPLCLSIMLAFGRYKAASLLLLATTLISAVIVGRIEWIAMVISFVVLGISYKLPNHQHKPTLYLCWIVVLIGCALLFVHLIPGFNNLKVLENVVSGPHSLPFSMYLNLDKPLAFFALLFAYPMLLGSKTQPQTKSALLVVLPLFSLLAIATLLGALKVELSLPNWWWLFAINNLMLTCVAEEALFRGFIQQVLSRHYAWWIGLLVASLLFGVAHIGGGLLLVVFATLAGLGYGLIFHFTGRLWCAIIIHFLFNFTHLVFFTYPASAH